MYKLETPGLLIAVEGIDAAGSSSLAGNLGQLMNQSGRKTFVTKEPTNSLIGGLINAALDHVWDPSPRTLQQLFVADRSHHLDRMILPNLKKGFHVISDRYYWSTLAFGMVNLEILELEHMNDAYPVADLTFVIDTNTEVTQARLEERPGKELFEGKSYQEMVRENYLELANRYPDGVWILNGHQTQEELARQAWEKVLGHPLIKSGERVYSRWIDPGNDCLLGHPDRTKLHHGWSDP